LLTAEEGDFDFFEKITCRREDKNDGGCDDGCNGCNVALLHEKTPSGKTLKERKINLSLIYTNSLFNNSQGC
jgi:hypothetical protein